MRELVIEQERAHLRILLLKLHDAKNVLECSIHEYSQHIRETKEYIWQNHTEMDGAEKAANRITVTESVDFGEKAVKHRQRIQKLIDSPYFGRIDFSYNPETTEKVTESFYIGVHTFVEPNGSEILIHDWRAPVSSLFYDFEKGEAYFTAPEGKVCGEIVAKRQYKIKDSTLEYVVESAINIGDEVLQKELSSTTDEKMKNIVATIQREQNAVIRNETSHTLILQGVAGSGKTSIALHRVAFLLYRFKGTLSSENVMILSPNKVFADYISNVLPELGEEQVAEIGFEEIAGDILDKKIKFQTFSEQVAELLEGNAEEQSERIRYKATAEFVDKLETWITKAENEGFNPHEITVQNACVSQQFIADRYELLQSMPVFERLDKIAVDVIHNLKLQLRENGGKWSASDNSRVKKQIRRMFRFADSLALYTAMYGEQKKSNLFVQSKKNKLEYCDVFPLVYVVLRTEKVVRFDKIKHLLVDEMQDYTPVQYAVLHMLFSCRMTILGDSNQSVNPFSSSSLEEIRKIFPQADCIELCKSYRSTAEITDFAQKISRNRKLIPVERHGEVPNVICCSTKIQQFDAIRTQINEFKKSGLHSLGIICKTQVQATTLYKNVTDSFNEIALLDFTSTSFSDGIIITSAHIAKGLEFDEVLIPEIDSENYQNELDKSMLYIACTRAMHRLTLLFSEEITPCLGENLENLNIFPFDK